MISHYISSQDRPSFVAAIQPDRLIGVILAAALVATGLAAFDTAQTHRAIAAHTEASDSTAPATNAGRSGAMLVYEPAW